MEMVEGKEGGACLGVEVVNGEGVEYVDEGGVV